MDGPLCCLIIAIQEPPDQSFVEGTFSHDTLPSRVDVESRNLLQRCDPIFYLILRRFTVILLQRGRRQYSLPITRRDPLKQSLEQRLGIDRQIWLSMRRRESAVSPSGHP